MEKVSFSTYKHRGVNCYITDEALDITGGQGVDLLKLVPIAINGMLLPDKEGDGDFDVSIHILNPYCSPDESIFEFKVQRITQKDA